MESPQRKRRLTLLLGGMACFSLMAAVGTVLTPSLIAEQPLVLLAFAPSWPHLVTLAPSTDPLPFYLITTARLLAADPIWYALGRDYGEDAVRWAEGRFGPAARFARRVQRAFGRWGPLFVFISPYNFVCLLSGAARMPLSRFYALNVAGTVTFLTVMRFFGQQLARPIAALTAWMDANSRPLTVGLFALVLLISLWRRSRRDGRGRDDELELDKPGQRAESEPPGD